MTKGKEKSGSKRAAGIKPTGASKKGGVSGNDDEELPRWPKIRPLVPSSDLSLEVLVPGQILTVSNFWTSALCKTFVTFLSSLSLTTTPGKPKRGDAVRVNDRFQVWDAAFVDRLWRETALKELVEGFREDVGESNGQNKSGLWGGEVVGLNPNIRIYRYGKGQFFDQHYDESNSVVLPTHPPTPTKTTWTLLLYLTAPSTGCVGGETVFYPEPAAKSGTKGKAKAIHESIEPIVIGLEVGLALLHKHGNDCLLHEAREVQQGEKWVIRSDLCVRR